MRNKKGFTLIELLVVIAIIGLLSTLAVVSLNNARVKARDAKRMADIKTLQQAIEMHIGDYEHAPAVPASWVALTTGVAADGRLTAYLPGGMPVPPGTPTATSNKFIYCVKGSPNNNKYLVGAILETTDAIAGDLDGAASYAIGECMVSTGLAPTGVNTPNCADGTPIGGGGNLDGAQTATVYCMGSLGT